MSNKKANLIAIAVLIFALTMAGIWTWIDIQHAKGKMMMGEVKEWGGR